jgi:hypothetical protein
MKHDLKKLVKEILENKESMSGMTLIRNLTPELQQYIDKLKLAYPEHRITLTSNNKWKPDDKSLRGTYTLGFSGPVNNELKDKISSLNEESSTGGGTAGAAFSAGVGMNYATPNAFKKVKKAVKETYGTGNLGPGPKASKNGVKDNYYVKKFGFKPVNRQKQAKASKAIDYKDLWGATYK